MSKSPSSPRLKPVKQHNGRPLPVSHQIQNTPGPGQYTLGSTFQSPKYGLTIKGRLPDQSKDANKPGPGDYSPPSAIGKEGRKFTLGPRTPATDATRASKDIPGPGAYTLPTTVGNPRGGFAIKGKIQEKIRNDVPGPGAYTLKTTVGDTLKFSLSPRVQYSPKNQTIPPPGNYDLKSTEFGHDFGKINISLHGKIETNTKNANPGPGSYEPFYYDISKQQGKITMKGRLTASDQKRNVYIPGPGAYTPRAIESAPSFSLKSRINKEVKSDVPGPGEYSLKTTVGNDTPSFTLKPRIPAPTNKSSEIPGPGTYDSKTSFGEAQKFTLKGKVPTLQLHEVMPGPGTYSIPTTIGSAKAFSLSPRIPDNSSKNKAYVPGPGAYTPREQQTHLGFMLKPRITSSPKNEVPGPGTYSPPTKIGEGPKHVFGTSA